MDKLSLFLSQNPLATGLTISGLIVVLGLLVYGFADLRKFTPKRIWAVSGVVFRESIRRKILWLTPLAMLGIIVLTGIQKPEDQSDAIRQTLQFCLFASGLLVVISGIMLSCTNLPRDIESKVIFTIVTKPITRLEIVAGKIVGFARVTGSILVLMGLFTWGYLHYRAWSLGKIITQQLSQTLDNEFARGRLEHQQREGLLSTRTLRGSMDLEMLARESATDSPIRWISTQQSFMVPFFVEPTQLIPQGFHDPAKGEASPNPADAGIRVRITLTGEQIGKVERAVPTVRAPLLPSARPKNPYGEAEFVLSIVSLDTEMELVPQTAINSGKPIEWMPDRYGKTSEIVIDAQNASALTQARRWAVIISPANENYLLGMAPGDVSIIVPGRTAELDQKIDAMKTDAGVAVLQPRGTSGRNGRMLVGPSEHFHSVAISHFDGATPEPGRDGKVTLEMMMNIDRMDDDASVDATQVAVEVVNRTSGKTSGAISVFPENGKIAYADVPVDVFEGGKFDVKLRVLTRGHAVALNTGSIMMVQERSSFAANLFKGLFAQWMLSILVVLVGMFCSTIVSWPIAIVLCVVLLMGRWAVDQVSDSLQPGIGATLATDLGAVDATQARVISVVGDGLARMLNVVSQFLPNIDAFSFASPLERGIAIPTGAMMSAVFILLLFGLPVFTLSYIFLRNKEVAP